MDETVMTKRKRKRKKQRSPGLVSRSTAGNPEYVMIQNAIVLDRVFAAGFKTFEDYLAARSGYTLVEMALELGVSEQRFIVYHAAWIDSMYLKGDVGPVRLED